MTRPAAPEPLGAYSQTSVVGDLCFISGQVPVAPDGSAPEAVDVTAQAEVVFANLSACLAAEGLEIQDVVSLTTYVCDSGDNAAVASVRARVFGDHRPTSTVVVVAGLLDPAWRLEVQAVAAMNRR